MERIDLKYQDATRALKSLEDILKESFTVVIRDASIQRFEYTFEAVWKYIKVYLEEKEGVVCNSPKSCFKSVFTVGLIEEDEATECLEMTDKRNDTVHTYKETVAEIIYEELPKYSRLMKKLLNQAKP